MMVPLWAEDNFTLDSAPFYVELGSALVLFATGLERNKVRQDSNTARDLQRICLSRLIRKYSIGAERQGTPPVDLCACGFVLETKWVKTVDIVDEIVGTNGCVWQLTQCDNMKILAIPGTYQLHLNDSTAIGKVQVYAEYFKLQDLPVQIPGLFFQ